MDRNAYYGGASASLSLDQVPVASLLDGWMDGRELCGDDSKGGLGSPAVTAVRCLLCRPV